MFRRAIIALLLVLSFLGCGGYKLDGKSAQPSVYMAIAYSGSEFGGATPLWNGTAFKVGEDMALTAGHVCESENFFGEKIRPDFIRLKDRFDGEWVAYPKRWVNDDDTDVCVLEARHLPGPSMKMNVTPLEYLEPLAYVGAPHGVWGDGVAPYAEGKYVGGNMMMIAGYPGASGSPVFNEGGVVGILVAGYRGTHLIVMEPARDVIEFVSQKD